MKRRPPLTSLSTYAFPWVTPADLARADEVHCDERTIRKMVGAGTLKATRVGRCLRIPVDEACRVFLVKRHLTTPQGISTRRT